MNKRGNGFFLEKHQKWGEKAHESISNSLWKIVYSLSVNTSWHEEQIIPRAFDILI